MKAIVATVVGLPLLAGLGMDFSDPAEAANGRQRGYTSHCYGTPEQCMRGYRPTRPTPRGYLPMRRGGGEYDRPRFGSERWWQLQEDRGD